MSVEEQIVEGIRNLPPAKLREVLDHVNRLKDDRTPRRPSKSIEGLWEDLNISISKEEIDEMRREMWKNFPRDDI